MPARAILPAACARPAWGGCLWLALVAVVLQAPSISVRHCHAGGADDHHHAWLPEEEHPDSWEDDLALPHGHRVVWGWDLHDPSGQEPDGLPGQDQPPAGVIQTSLSPAEENQTRHGDWLPEFPSFETNHHGVPRDAGPEGARLRGLKRFPVSPSGPLVLRV